MIVDQLIADSRSVIAITLLAFSANDMKWHVALSQAVIALDRHEFVSILRRHRHFGNLCVVEACKELRVANRLPAKWARNICPAVTLVAMKMHGVTAPQETCCLARVLHAV